MLQEKLDLSLNSYKEFYKIYNKTEINIVFSKKMPLTNEKIEYFISWRYYHIYLDDDKEITINDIIKENKSVSDIKLVIDYDIKSFKELFYSYDFIYKIDFIKCKRKDITDLSRMFYGCKALKFDKFNSFNDEHPENIPPILLTFILYILLIFKLFKDEHA